MAWLRVAVGETGLLWEFIKSGTSGSGKSSNFSLPFPIVEEKEVMIGKVAVREGSSCEQILKNWAHDLKFLMNFEFSQRK